MLVASADGTQWDKDFKLAPMETRAISVGDLVHNAVKDDKGKTLPAKAVSGQISWWTVGTASGPGIGRLLQSNLATGTARSFACGCPYILCGTSFLQTVSAIVSGDTETPLDTLTPQICLYKSSCGGTTTSNSSSQALNYSWQTSNSAILQISGSSANSSVNVYGASVGSSNMTGTVSAIYLQPARTCTFSGGGSASVTPAILLGGCGGTNITNTTQTVVTGQQIVLCGSYGSSVSVNSQSWSVPGKIVGGFSTAPTNGGPNPVALNGQQTTFYWTAGASNQTVTFTLNYGNNQTANATATFTINGVTSPLVTTSLGVWQIGSGPILEFGDPAGTPGIKFVKSAQTPFGYTGAFEWVQLVTNSNYTCVSSAGTKPVTETTPALDTSYPYSTAASTTDSPQVPLPSVDSQVTWNFGATMYLMWRPGITNDIYVPLGYVTWQAYGDGVQSNGNWSAQSDSSGSANSFVQSSSYPQWTRTLGSFTPCP